MQPRLLKQPVHLAGPALLALQSDDRLVRLARDGHGPAFAAIVDRYRGALLRSCSRLVGEQRAEDAVQQAFVNAHRALTERDAPAELRPWLYRIAHNAAVNTLRAETGDPSLDDPDAAVTLAHTAGDAEGLEATVVRRERLQDTLAAISALPAPQRDALVLRELEGRSHVEIAAALGVTAGAARQHLMRARAAVRAAATAVTPYPLVVKVATWMTFTPTGERVTQVAAGAGLGAGVAKVAAGVLATGALVGGVVGTGAVPVLRHDRPSSTARSPAAATSVREASGQDPTTGPRLEAVELTTAAPPPGATQPLARRNGAAGPSRTTKRPGSAASASSGARDDGQDHEGTPAAADGDDRRGGDAADKGPGHGSGSSGSSDHDSGSSSPSGETGDDRSPSGGSSGTGVASDSSGPGGSSGGGDGSGSGDTSGGSARGGSDDLPATSVSPSPGGTSGRDDGTTVSTTSTGSASGGSGSGTSGGSGSSGSGDSGSGKSSPLSGTSGTSDDAARPLG